MKSCNDLEFLASYWEEAKRIGSKTKEELPNIRGNSSTYTRGKLVIIQYSDLENSWSVDDILCKMIGNSKTLEILADKINFMILKGRGNDVATMVKKICTGRIKNLKKPAGDTALTMTGYRRVGVAATEYLGKGHFRWNNQPHTLTDKEIEHLKSYFKLN